MSPTDPGRFTDSGTIWHPTGHPIAPTPGGDHASVPDRAAGEGVLATKPQPPRRPITRVRVGPSRRSDPHSFNDPCNYLG